MIFCLMPIATWYNLECAEYTVWEHEPRVNIVIRREGDISQSGSIRKDFDLFLYRGRPGRHVGFFWNNKICFNSVSILFEKIKLTVSERTYIIIPVV